MTASATAITFRLVIGWLETASPTIAGQVVMLADVQYYTLENPWPAAIVLGIIGCALFMHGLVNQRRRLGRAGAGLVVIAAVLFGLASLIETNREVVTAQTESLVTAALKGDTAAVERFVVAPDGQTTPSDRGDLKLIVGRGGAISHSGRDRLLSMVGALPALVESNAIRSIQSVGADDESIPAIFHEARRSDGRDMMVIRLSQTTRIADGESIPNQWLFIWVRGEGAGAKWRLSGLVWEKWGLNQIPGAGMLP